MSYGNDICVYGRPSWSGGFSVPSPVSLIDQRLYIQGKHWAISTYFTNYPDRPMISTRHWYSPDLTWLAELKAECAEFEWNGKGWRAERDGYEYLIPERWSERTVTREEW